MASQDSQSDANLLEDLKAELQDHKQQINLLGLLKTNLLADVTCLQKTVAGLQNKVSDLQDTFTSLKRSTVERQKATEANILARLINGHITSPIAPLIRLRDPLNRHIPSFPANIRALQDMRFEDVAALLAIFDIPNEDVKVRDKRLLAVYIGVKLELL